jgi:hypothetical protein
MSLQVRKSGISLVMYDEIKPTTVKINKNWLHEIVES